MALASARLVASLTPPAAKALVASPFLQLLDSSVRSRLLSFAREGAALSICTARLESRRDVSR
jgi:hypothetical protein